MKTLHADSFIIEIDHTGNGKYLVSNTIADYIKKLEENILSLGYETNHLKNCLARTKSESTKKCKACVYYLNFQQRSNEYICMKESECSSSTSLLDIA